MNCCTEFDKNIEKQKTELNARITSEFHSTGKNKPWNLSKFAESKTAEFTQTRKNINYGTEKRNELCNGKRH